MVGRWWLANRVIDCSCTRNSRTGELRRGRLYYFATRPLVRRDQESVRSYYFATSAHPSMGERERGRLFLSPNAPWHRVNESTAQVYLQIHPSQPALSSSLSITCSTRQSGNSSQHMCIQDSRIYAPCTSARPRALVRVCVSAYWIPHEALATQAQ